jgi:hypothetical protein
MKFLSSTAISTLSAGLRIVKTVIDSQNFCSTDFLQLTYFLLVSDIQKLALLGLSPRFFSF